MAEITEEQRALIQTVVSEVYKQHKETFWVDPEQHFLDHQLIRGCAMHQDEMKKNHDFVSDLRRGTGLVRKVTIMTAIGTAIPAMIWWIIYHLKH